MHQKDRMTVSPNQPQDGSIPASQGPGGNRVDAPHSSEPLPPTLFALPNLRAEATKTRKAQQPSTDANLRHADPAPVVNVEETGVSDSIQHPEIASSDAKIIRHDRPIVMADVASSDHQDTRDIDTIADPASFGDSDDETSLLDHLGSHAIVLTMLLVVFGIALLAGRKPITGETTPMATITDVIETPQVVSKEETNGTSIAVNVSTEPTDDKANDWVALSQFGESAKVEVNASESPEATQQSTGVSASTVSTRSPNVTENDSASVESKTDQVDETLPPQSTPVNSVPSLDSLSSTESANETAATPNRYRYSKTPRKISDWSRYLIQYQDSYVTPTSATVTQP